MTAHQYRAVRNLAVGAFVLFLLTGVYTFWSGYQGRVDQHHDLVKGCERRGNPDRRDGADRDMDIARFADRAAAARRADGDLEVAREYERISKHAAERGNRTRARIVDCDRAFPEPSLFNW